MVMEVEIYANRKPTGTVLVLDKMDNSSLETLVSSVGGPERAKSILEAGVRAAAQSWYAAHTDPKRKEGQLTPEEAVEAAHEWDFPKPRGVALTPEEKIRKLAGELGLSADQVAKMLAAAKDSKSKG